MTAFDEGNEGSCEATGAATQDWNASTAFSRYDQMPIDDARNNPEWLRIFSENRERNREPHACRQLQQDLREDEQEPITNGAKMAERNAKGQLLPGHPGGPGRPKGSRHKLGEEFLAALLDDFNENGVAAIAAAREQNPSAYLKTIAMIVPKSLEVDMGEPFAETFERFIREIGVSKRVAGPIEVLSCERGFHRDLISQADDDDNPIKR